MVDNLPFNAVEAKPMRSLLKPYNPPTKEERKEKLVYRKKVQKDEETMSTASCVSFVQFVDPEEFAVKQALRRVVEVFYVCQAMRAMSEPSELLLFSDRVFKQDTRANRTVTQQARSSKTTMLTLLNCEKSLPYWKKYVMLNLTYSNLFAMLKKECSERMQFAPFHIEKKQVEEK